MIINDFENYIYKKEVDWSLFNYGFAIPLDFQVVFKQISGRMLARGESQEITLFLDGKPYRARLNNNSINKKYGNHSDIVQIRYTENSEIAVALRECFKKSYYYIKSLKEQKEKGDKTVIRLPNESKEYIAIYTTEADNAYIIEPIFSEDYAELKTIVSDKNERIVEAEFNYESKDDSAGFNTSIRTMRIRKLNRKIGENLKLLYGYRCQICGEYIGEEYGTHVVESHHIDYFVKSLNNDASNQLIVCPNHHSIIHNANPRFDRKNLSYVFDNGFTEKLRLNKHL